ncbi:MAG: hypothetical protein A4E30_01652 [Methanomassiliicoccales archaeon PtaB.Bin215]|nr:MAG: hypothetical protein A4E30_01652 [Methanomassiliicoccales archaeon PtaB.Bin215]
MEVRGELLVSTFGKEVGEIVAGMRSLPHDHLVLVTDSPLGEGSAVLSFLNRLGIRHEVLLVDPSDITGSALLIERKVQEHIEKGWRARVDITGGRKLLSDSAMLAALSTGAEVCCFEMEARRFPLLTAMGVREALPDDLAEVLSSQRWPMPLIEVGMKGKDHPLPPMLRRMKQMDLVHVEEGDVPMICLTERGRACLDWILRTKELSGSSE